MFSIKKTVSLLLTLMMIIGVVTVAPFTSSAKTSGDYEYAILDDGTIEITEYDGTDSELTIPSELDSYKIKSIGEAAFCCCNSLTSVTVSDGIKVIGASAFEGCRKLATITLPDSITSIGEDAFSNTSYYKTTDNWESNVLYIGKHLIKAQASVSGSCDVKSDTVTIADSAFAMRRKLTDITGADSVKNIGVSAFIGCEKLSSITIPDGVTNIKPDTFKGCKSLTSISIPGTVTKVSDGAFYGCSGFTSVTIGSKVKKIGFEAFASCSALTSVKIGSAVKYIGDMAFAGCTNLATISIPDSVTDIGDEAFAGTSFFKTKSNWTDSVLYINNHLIKAKTSISGDYTITSGTKTIAAGAFTDCSSLKSVTIPDSVKKITDNLFAHCTALTSITIPENVTSIGNCAFADCVKLSTISIPDSVTQISCYAFENTAYYNKKDNWEDSALYIGKHLIRAKRSVSDSFTVKDGTLSIAEKCFYDCGELTSVTIPDTVTKICAHTFECCEDLTSIDIPANATAIGEWAFANCTALSSVTISDKVTSIGDNAFFDCKRLKSVTIPYTVTKIGNNAFGYYGDFWIPSKVKSFAISGYTGSKAEKYAANNGFDFTSLGDAPADASSDTKASETTATDQKDISDWQVSGLKSKDYSGKSIKQSIKVYKGSEVATVSVEYLNNKNAGSAKLVIKGTGKYTGKIVKTFKIKQIKNTMTANAKSQTVKYSTVKKKSVTVSPLTVKKAQGKVSYKKSSGKSNITVNASSGKVTVKKGIKKGNYTVKVKVTAKGNNNYKSGAKTATVKIKIK